MNPQTLIRRMHGERRGTATLETAIVAPVLVLLSLGGFDVSSIVSRQNELQSAAAEAAAIARASPPTTVGERNTMRDVIKVSTGIKADENVTVAEIYRCGTNAAYTANKASCAAGVAIATFVRVRIKDRYDPSWTQFGVGEAVNYNVERTVQVS